MTKLWPWLLVVLALCYGYAQAHRSGVLDAELRAARRDYAALEERGVRVDSVFVRDTVTLTRWRTQYGSVRTQARYSDTVWVKAFVGVADSTIHACSVALETCQERVALRDSLIGNLKNQLTIERKRRPGLFAQLGQKILFVGIGFGAAKLLSR